MYNVINHFAESEFKSKALGEFFTSRAHSAEKILEAMFDSVDTELTQYEFLSNMPTDYNVTPDACIILDDDGVYLRPVILAMHSAGHDEIIRYNDWSQTNIPTIKGAQTSVLNVVNKLTTLIREGYIAAAGLTVVGQGGSISDFRDILSERLSNAYQDVSGQLNYWAALIRSKQDPAVILARAIEDMTPDITSEDHATPPKFETTPYAGVSSACPLELVGLNLSALGLIPSVIGQAFEAYFAGVWWVAAQVVRGIKSVSKGIAKGFTPYEAVTFTGGQSGIFKYGGWIGQDAVVYDSIPRVDDRWDAIREKNQNAITVNEILAIDLSFGQFLFQCEGDTIDGILVTSVFKPKVNIPLSNTVLWGSYEDGTFIFPPDPVKTLASISNRQAFKSIIYSELLALATSRMALQELSGTTRPSGSVSLLADAANVISATDIADALGGTGNEIDFIAGQTLGSAMNEVLSNLAKVVVSFLFEKIFYPVDYEFMAFTSSLVGWPEVSYDLVDEDAARSDFVDKTTTAAAVAAAAALAIKFGPALSKAINRLRGAWIGKASSAFAKAASGQVLTSSEIRAVRKLSSNLSLVRPTYSLYSLGTTPMENGENEYSMLCSLITGVYP